MQVWFLGEYISSRNGHTIVNKLRRPWSILENAKILNFLHLVNHFIFWPMTWAEHNGMVCQMTFGTPVYRMTHPIIRTIWLFSKSLLLIVSRDIVYATPTAAAWCAACCMKCASPQNFRFAANGSVLSCVSSSQLTPHHCQIAVR